MEQFFCRTRIYAGHGSLQVLPSLHIRRLLIVADPFFYENGTVNHIAHLARADAVEVFHKVSPDPTVSLVAEGVRLAQDFQPDTLLALGGGSAMDCGKAMAFFSGLPLQRIAVPTTSGSGAEVTDFAILTHGGVKHPMVDEGLRPDVAILDDALLEALPRKLIAETGFDLISHAMESWAATGSGTISEAMALEALKLAFLYLPKSYAGDLSARLPVHKAATMAAMAFSCTGLGLCHGLSHALGGQFHIPHGRLNAILLPAVMDVNAPAAAHRYRMLAAHLGFGTGTMAQRNLKSALLRLRKNMGLPETLAQAGIHSEQLQAHMEPLVKATLADSCCRTNPTPVDEATVRRVLQLVAGHG